MTTNALDIATRLVPEYEGTLFTSTARSSTGMLLTVTVEGPFHGECSAEVGGVQARGGSAHAAVALAVANHRARLAAIVDAGSL